MAVRQIAFLLATALASSPVAADDPESCEEQVRKLVGLVRSDGTGDVSDVRFLPAKPLAVEPLYYELKRGDEPVEYTLLRCVPGGDSVAVQYLEVITCSPEWAGAPPADQCLRLREGAIPLAEYRKLLGLLDGCARVEFRGPPPRRYPPLKLPGDRPQADSFRELRWRLSVGRTPVSEGRIGGADKIPFGNRGPLSESERGFLSMLFIQRKLDQWRFRFLKESSSDSGFWAGLAADLKVGGGWRKELRLAAIALAGRSEFGRWVDSLEPSSPWVRLAKAQTRVRTACSVSTTPPAGLKEMMGSKHTLVRMLGLNMLRRAYPEAYRSHLASAFARVSDGPTKLKVLDDYESAFGMDPAFLRKALSDVSPIVRAAAAARLRDRVALHRILDECSSDTTEGLQARISAIHALAWRGSAIDKDLGPKLVAVARDALDDVRIRKLACEALGWLGYEAGVDTLVRVLQEGRRDDPTYRAPIGRAERTEVRYRLWDDPRIGAAKGLGLLRAKRAVRALVRCLGETGLEECALREAIGDALGYIGDQSALRVLLKTRDTAEPEHAESWGYAIGFLKALGRRDGPWLLEHCRREAPGFLPRLLAQEFTLEELDVLLTAARDDRERRARVNDALQLKGSLPRR